MATALIPQFLLLLFAVHFLATSVAYEDGPFGLFRLLREGIISSNWAPAWLRDGIQCPICLGFWFSLLLSALFVPFTADFFLIVLALAGLNSLIERKW